MLPFTEHGGNLAAAITRFGGEPDGWLDLSTGINPDPWPGTATLPLDWQRFPAPHVLRELEEAAAIHFGCAPAHVLAVPGSELGLRLLGPLLPAPVFCRVPAYHTHQTMVPETRPLADAGLGAAEGASLILANPSNPDGRLLPRTRLLALLEERRGGLLVVDEAYADCHPQESLAPFVADHQPLVVLRSFGKFFGLPGVRLGFVLGPEPLLTRLRTQLGSWPLSTAALAIGHAAYRDRKWIRETRRRLQREAKAFDGLLLAAGLRAEGSSPLFRRLAVPDALPLFTQLARRHILTRPFADAPRHLRLGLPKDAAARARLQQALGHG